MSLTIQGFQVDIDADQEFVTICGIKYAFSLFQAWGEHGLDHKALFRIVERADGVITIEVREPFADWQPIDTAPVPPPTEVGNTYTYRFPCLLQLKDDVVVSGFGAYMRPCATALVERLELRWYNDRGRRLHGPKYWMPLPAPKVET